MKRLFCRLILMAGIAGLSASTVLAETGYDLWLRYVPVEDAGQLAAYRSRASQIVAPGNSETMRAMRGELKRGLDGLLDQQIPVSGTVTLNGAIVAGTPQTVPAIRTLGWSADLTSLGKEGYLIRSAQINGRRVTVIASTSDIGALYGVFHFLRLIQTRQPVTDPNISERPAVQLRLLDHWDNLDGSVERGYAGKSLWKWEELPETIDPRYTDYARTNASIGMNGAVLNNVNANPQILTERYLQKVAALAGVFRPYGIRVYLSANFGAPLKPSATPGKQKQWGGIGDLDTADPLDPKVQKWWREKVDEIYRFIPDFGGFLVKANSEGMPGPQTYGRTHAQGANMLADALAPHGGVVMWRAFVYPENADPDRAKRAYQEFVPLDGAFRKNVLIQAKNGPLDFQPREPFHPLFGAMPNTPVMAELQITQEYLGHATHLVYLAPMWKEFLDADTYTGGQPAPVSDIIDGSVFSYGLTGMAGVANTGDDANWCGHPFAQANWYAFGRLAWNPALSAERIAREWIRMTWSNDAQVVGAIAHMMLGSWRACVNYMTPLGLDFTVEGGFHYDPQPSKRDGRYWFADTSGIGYDRTAETGSDAVSQYHEPLRSLWDDPDRCPEDYLLWFHFMPWDHTMASGRSLWEEFVWKYYEGVRYVDGMKKEWDGLQGFIDPGRFRVVDRKLSEQQAHARKWRDTCVNYFQSQSRRPLPDVVK